VSDARGGVAMRSSLKMEEKMEDTFGCRGLAGGAKPRAASSEQNEPASGVGSPIPTCFGALGRVARRIISSR